LTVGTPTPLETRCSWKRRMSSKLAAHGDRPKKAAKALMARM
jgi:hypothetical protein